MSPQSPALPAAPGTEPAVTAAPRPRHEVAGAQLSPGPPASPRPPLGTCDWGPGRQQPRQSALRLPSACLQVPAQGLCGASSLLPAARGAATGGGDVAIYLAGPISVHQTPGSF